MKMFFTSSINEYQLVSNHINYLYEQYNQINQFINSNFPVEYHNLLAVPEKVGDQVNWYTDKKICSKYTMLVDMKLIINVTG